MDLEGVVGFVRVEGPAGAVGATIKSIGSIGFPRAHGAAPPHSLQAVTGVARRAMAETGGNAVAWVILGHSGAVPGSGTTLTVVLTSVVRGAGIAVLAGGSFVVRELASSTREVARASCAGVGREVALRVGSAGADDTQKFVGRARSFVGDFVDTSVEEHL